MQLEKKNQRELAKRKGLASKTIAQSIWLLISGVVVYFAVDYLFETEYLTYGLFYSTLSIPGWVPEWAILVALVLVGMTIMQFFFVLGYMVASPSGRAHTGEPTAYAEDLDPLEQMYRDR